MAKSPQKARTRWEDRIVAEVRKIREDLFAAAGYDLDVFCRQLQQQERQEECRVVTLAPRKPEGVGAARGRPSQRVQPTRKKAGESTSLTECWPLSGLAPSRGWKPIAIKGKSLSETVIEERR